MDYNYTKLANINISNVPRRRRLRKQRLMHIIFVLVICFSLVQGVSAGQVSPKSSYASAPAAPSDSALSETHPQEPLQAKEIETKDSKTAPDLMISSPNTDDRAIVPIQWDLFDTT